MGEPMTLPNQLRGANNWNDLQVRPGVTFKREEFFEDAKEGNWTYIRGWGGWRFGNPWTPRFDSPEYYDALRALTQQADGLGILRSAMLFNWYETTEESKAAYTNPSGSERAYQSAVIQRHVNALKGLNYGLEVINEGPTETLRWQRDIVSEIHRLYPGVPVFVNSGYGGSPPSLGELLELGAEVTAAPLKKGYNPRVSAEGRRVLIDTDHWHEGLNAPTRQAGYDLVKPLLVGGYNVSCLCCHYAPLEGWGPEHPWNNPKGHTLGYRDALKEAGKKGEDPPPPPPPEDDPEDKREEEWRDAKLFLEAVVEAYSGVLDGDWEKNHKLRRKVRRLFRRIRREE